jgi:hypothetical protein
MTHVAGANWPVVCGFEATLAGGPVEVDLSLDLFHQTDAATLH